MVEERGCVVEHIAVELSERDDELSRVSERVVDGDEVGSDEGTGAPEDLEVWIKLRGQTGQITLGQRTAVTVSMQSTKASWVRYRESLSEYSFHSCPKRSCMPPMLLKL